MTKNVADHRRVHGVQAARRHRRRLRRPLLRVGHLRDGELHEERRRPASAGARTTSRSSAESDRGSAKFDGFYFGAASSDSERGSRRMPSQPPVGARRIGLRRPEALAGGDRHQRRPVR
ncbi:MAG: hypothetical protein M0C28_18200 [Candidatus Moduliflexus flocculans]|nr:hypothetical protein [Candidatus Moduliflexus flocculans]